MTNPKINELHVVSKDERNIAMSGVKPLSGPLGPCIHKELSTDCAVCYPKDRNMTTDTEELSRAIKQFEKCLPGWWWSVGHCSFSRDASCGPDLSGPDEELLRLPETRLFDEGFHCDDQDGTLAGSLRKITIQAVEARGKWKKQ